MAGAWPLFYIADRKHPAPDRQLLIVVAANSSGTKDGGMQALNCWMRQAVLLFAALWLPAVGMAKPTHIGEHYVICVDVKYDYPESGQSTWFYMVESHGPPAISHYTLGLACETILILDAGVWDGIDPENRTSGGGTPVPGSFPAQPRLDPTTGVTGLKFDQGFDDIETRHYYFTVNGNYAAADIVFAVKAGQQITTGYVTGPSDDCDMSLNAAIELTKTGATVYRPVQVCDVFGLAHAFNALIFGDLTANGGDTENRLAVGGTARFTGGYSVGIPLFGNPIPTYYGDAVDMLIVGGDLYDGAFGVNGNIVYGGHRYGPARIMANGNRLRHVMPVTFDAQGNVPWDGSGTSFAALQSLLTGRSTILGNFADRGVVAKDTSQPYFITLTGNDPELNVFNLTVPPGAVINAQIDISAPPESSVLVNIHGAEVHYQNSIMNLAGVTREMVLFNYVDATNIVSSGFTHNCSVLALHASADLSGGSVEGRAVFGGNVNTYRGFEFHNYPFAGQICLDTLSSYAAFIVYTFTVRNVGDVALTNVTIQDPLITVAGNPIALAPGEIDDTTFSGVYIITPADLAAGVFSNTATATGETPAGAVVSDTDTDVQEFLAPVPSILANGSSDTLTVARGEPVTIAATMFSGFYAGLNVDWWLAVIPDFSDYWYCLDSTGNWAAFPAGEFDQCRPIYQGQLMDMPSPVTLIEGEFLVAGNYTLFFAIDALDGILNYPGGPIIYDTLQLTVQD